jgi:hypothetical protein
MNRLWIVTFALLTPLTAQELNLKFLDRLEPLAKESNAINLGPEELRSGLDAAKVAPEIQGLTSVFVRSFEFGKPGVWTTEDFDKTAAEVQRYAGCAPFIKTKGTEMAQIYLCSGKDEKKTFAVVSAEPDEFTIVVIKGAVDFSTLGKMDKIMGAAAGSQAPTQKELVKRAPAAPKKDE